MPFLPLYFQLLGVHDVGKIALWSGLSLGVTPALTALLSPFWGRLADRYGRKIMVERSLFSFVIVMAGMAFVTRAWHVFALARGAGALCRLRRADPHDGCRLGAARPHGLGDRHHPDGAAPRSGDRSRSSAAASRSSWGCVRRSLSRRSSTSSRSSLVFVMYDEHAVQHELGSGRDRPASRSRSVLAFENFILLMAVIFALQFVDRSFGPMLPLYVTELGTPPSRVPLVAGLLFSIAAGAGALGHHRLRRLLRDCPGARCHRTASAAVGAVGALAYSIAGGTGLLLAGTPIFGLAIGVSTTAAYTAAGAVIPASARGAGFGLLTTASLVGLALSPIVSGFLAATSIRAVFWLDTAAMATLAFVVPRLMLPARLSAGATVETAEDI